MANTIKTLGQAAPSSTSNVDLYTATAGKSAIGSTLYVCNTTATATTYRVFKRIGGATAAASNAIAYDTPLAGNATATITTGLAVGTLDVITVQSGTANALTFTLDGNEIA